jgi:hypothetical protein
MPPCMAGNPSPDSSPWLVDLVFPLATLLGLAERPGEGHWLGPLDPGLCRVLAASAAASPHTTVCVTVTDDDGIAIGHGCARKARKTRAGPPGRYPEPATAFGRRDPALPLPSRVNLTITASLLSELTATPAQPRLQSGTVGPRPPGSWSLARDGDPGPPDGFGSWAITLPDGRNLTVKLEPVPTFSCDHRYETHAYQPSDKLRHLVQIRDYECTLPVCSRHARDSDFEHAVPFDKGGRTDACNAGARSRQCHRIKQSKGWNVTQPRPGWHLWQTPSGRTYLQGPKQYPVLDIYLVTT